MSSSIVAAPVYQSKDQTSNQNQSQQNATISKLTSNPLNGGNLLPGISIKSGSNTIPHKLGSKLTGWFIVSPKSAAKVYETASDATNLTVTSDADLTCSLFVF